MRTIERILKELWTTEKEIRIKCKEIWCNGCWWKGGFNYTEYLRSLPYFQKEKEQRLLEDITLLCNYHDLLYSKWWKLKDFIRANYIFVSSIITLLHWTNILWRLFIFIVIFIWMTIWWRKYFNFK